MTKKSMPLYGINGILETFWQNINIFQRNYSKFILLVLLIYIFFAFFSSIYQDFNVDFFNRFCPKLFLAFFEGPH